MKGLDTNILIHSTGRYPRELIAGVIEKILRTEEFVAENAAETWAALGKYRQGRADFADCLIGTTNKALGCSETATFDRIASRIDSFGDRRNRWAGRLDRLDRPPRGEQSAAGIETGLERFPRRRSTIWRGFLVTKAIGSALHIGFPPRGNGMGESADPARHVRHRVQCLTTAIRARL